MSKSQWSSMRVVAVIAACGGLMTASAQEAAPAAAEAAVVVKVNDAVMTESDLDAKVAARMKAIGQQVPPEQLAQLEPRIRSQVEEEFVMRTLLQEAMTAEAITADAGEVDALMEETKANLPPGVTFEQVLSFQGFTPDQMKDELAFQVSVRKLLDAKVGDEVAVSEEEIASFYEQNQAQMQTPESVTARHILIKVEEGADEDAKAAGRKEMAAIRQELMDGADFAEVAASKSHCPSKQQGGSLGQFGRGSMVPPFEEAAFSQPVGEVGEIVETRFGFHIIEVTDKADGGSRSLEDVRDQIASQLQNQKRGQAFQTYVESLKSAATIEFPAAPSPATP